MSMSMSNSSRRLVSPGISLIRSAFLTSVNLFLIQPSAIKALLWETYSCRSFIPLWLTVEHSSKAYLAEKKRSPPNFSTLFIQTSLNAVQPPDLLISNGATSHPRLFSTLLLLPPVPILLPREQKLKLLVIPQPWRPYLIRNPLLVKDGSGR